MSQSDEQLQAKRHSLAHLLAAAVMQLWPNTKRTIGPAIEDGFYYDFEFSQPISEADLAEIEAKMREILPTWDKFERSELTAQEAKQQYPDNPYKHELIDEFTKDGAKVTFYKSGEFSDLCRGGHAESMHDIDPLSFKLDRVAGAYWRGDENNPMLTRIYGLAFNTQKELEDYLNLREEAGKRDHKKLGPQHKLFMFHPTSPGMPYWLPHGVTVLNELINFWREEHKQRGYQEIISPILNKKELYVTSGHFEHYWPDMFVAKTEEGEEYGVKAMNCPNAMIVFASESRSYRDLPLRLSDTDPLHRNERSGTLNGLLRAREFKQDDAHIFVTEEMIGPEYQAIFEIVERFYSIFDIQYTFRLGTRPESFLGDAETWNQAEATLREILENSGKEYTVAEGDGAFYGPKVDILMRDALNREWQMGTIQLDFQQPRRFDLSYIDAEGQKKTPIAIHRVIYGSLERFIGILIEHYAAAFPLWLSPVHVKIVPISEKHISYARQAKEQLLQLMPNLRIEIDERDESVGKKIREASVQKVPYLAVVGDKEGEAQGVAVRGRNELDLGVITIKEFAERLEQEIKEKR
jgi:threonyl-tRNA synthetase